MAGYVIMFDGDDFGFHKQSRFPNVRVENVKQIQLDGDELELGLALWPMADQFAPPGRVRIWEGAVARRFAVKFQEFERGSAPTGAFFLLYPSSNNAPHLVSGPYGSLREARNGRAVSGDLVVSKTDYGYRVAEDGSWLWEWERHEGTFAAQHWNNATRFLSSNCASPLPPRKVGS